MKKLLLIPVLTIFFMCASSITEAEWVITQVTDNTYGDNSPQINDSGHVVWNSSGALGTDYEIFYYDGSTITQLTDSEYFSSQPKISDNGHVVWYGTGGSDNGIDYEIFYYDGTTITQLTENTGGELGPQINDSGQAVWYGTDGSDFEIFYYDGSTVTQLTNNSINDENPRINASGHVVWQGYDGNDNEIFYYDGSTITQLTNNSVDDYDPQISDGGQVVWASFDDTDYMYDMFYYDGSTTTQLTDTADSSETDYSINASGHVAWEGFDGTDSEIYYYDGSSITQLTNNSASDSDPLIINSSGHVAWLRHTGISWEIFYYDGSTITQVTDSEDYGSPRINDSGQVVWNASDGNDHEIYLAEYCVPATVCTSVFECGTEDDGCGGTIDCGTCSDEERCKDNMCIDLDAPIEDLITHYYLYILLRAPDPGGLTFWSGEMMRLNSLGVDIIEGFIALAKTFFNSQEYLDRNRDDEEYVTDLYNTFFDREPDSGGLAYWINELDQGVSRNMILNFFVFSDEFNDFMIEISGESEKRPENNMVNNYYRGLLSRAPDNGGFAYWLGRFRDEQCDGNSESIRAQALAIASAFINSQEYTNRSRDDLGYIEDLYDAFMRRSGDSAGVNHFLDGLDAMTYTRQQLLNIFVNSSEFQGKVQTVIDAGCYE